jgi:diguanylate cyclase (GGDEF)-like protein
MLVDSFRRAALAALLLAPLLLVAPSLQAEQAEQVEPGARGLQQFAIEHWSTRDGLPHNSVNRIVQDAQGYLWLATWDGPVRFNGREFLVFDNTDVTGLPDNGVFSAHVQQGSGAVIFGGDRAGLAAVQQGQWRALPSAGGFVYDIRSDAAGALWVATAGAGVRRIAPDGTSRVYTTDHGLPSDTVYRLSFDADGVLWAATTRGLARLQPGQDAFEVEASVPAVVVRSLLVHSDGSLYVGALDVMLRRAAGDTEFVRVAADQAIQGTFTVFHEGPEGALWYGTFEHGLGRLLNGRVERFTVADGLPNQHVLDIHTDHEGSTWVSTHNGLMQFRDAPANSLTRRHGLIGDYLRALAEDVEGRLVVGSNRGVSLVSPGQVRVLPGDKEALADLSVLSLATDARGLLHIGSYTQGVMQWFDGQVTARLSADEGLPSRQVRALAAGADGSLWIGTASGLVKATTTPGRIEALQTLTSRDGLRSDFVSSLLVSQHGDVWVGSLEGVSRIALAGEQAGVIESYEFDSLGDVRGVFGLAEDSRAVFAASDRGLLVFPQATRQWQLLDRRHGLMFEKYFAVTVDHGGDVWLGSSRGVHRLDRARLDAVLSGERERLTLQHFGVSDGMRSPQVNTGSLAALTDTNGDVWFATAEGAAGFSPRRLNEYAQTRPPAVIETAKADGLTFANAAVLPPGRNRLAFSYAGLGYRMPGQIRYQTRLSSVDDDWVERADSMSAEYTYLPPGNYQFSVRAAYPGGQWGEPATLHFQLRPELWQQRWFWALATLALFGAIVLAVRWRLLAMARSQQRLQALVAEKTQELERLSREDGLTGLANRRSFDEALRREILHSQRYQQPLSLIMLDVDHFKQINDRFHHAAGDEVLQTLARHLSEWVRDTDLAARWGGEEFILLMPNARLDEALVSAERLREAIGQLHYPMLGEAITVTASFGVAEWQDGELSGELLARVDRALYQAKGDGRNRVVKA